MAEVQHTITVNGQYSDDTIRVVVAAAQFNEVIIKYDSLLHTIPTDVARALVTLQRSLDMLMSPQRHITLPKPVMDAVNQAYARGDI